MDHKLIDEKDIAALKAKILASGLTISQLVITAWASASTFRGSDKRGGANGARIRLAPQKDWEVNQPAELAKVLKTLEGIQKEFNSARREEGFAGRPDRSGRRCAVEKAAKKAGHEVNVPFSPGRTDASQEQTDVHSFAVLEPAADGFRNYLKRTRNPAEEMLVDRAQLLTLTAPEMTVLVGGMRVLNANYGQSKHGVFTKRPETLTNDFFVNLLDMNTAWKPASTEDVYEGAIARRAKSSGPARVSTYLRFKLQLRAIAEVYACDDSREVRERLRGGLDQGDEPGSLRSGLS